MLSSDAGVPEGPREPELGVPELGVTVEVAGRVYRAARLGPYRVVSIRHIGAYSGVSATWARLSGFVRERQLLSPWGRAIGIVYDDPVSTTPDHVRYDACFAIPDEAIETLLNGRAAILPPGVRVEKIDSGLSWLAVHIGDYASLADVYSDAADPAAFARYGVLPPSGTPPMFESYLNDPNTTPTDGLITEVYLPITARSSWEP